MRALGFGDSHPQNTGVTQESAHSQPCKFPRTNRIKTFSILQAWRVIECSILVIISGEPSCFRLTVWSWTIVPVCAHPWHEATMSPERGPRRATPATGACVPVASWDRGEGRGQGPPADIGKLISNTVAYPHTRLNITPRQIWSHSVFSESKWCRPTHRRRGSHVRGEEQSLQPVNVVMGI